MYDRNRRLIDFSCQIATGSPNTGFTQPNSTATIPSTNARLTNGAIAVLAISDNSTVGRDDDGKIGSMRR